MKFKSPIFRRLFLFLAIIGPGIITSNVDNDAGGITTYSVAGADLGYKILWIFLPMILALMVIQEMCARMGAVTGKGLADLIRERLASRSPFMPWWACSWPTWATSCPNLPGWRPAWNCSG